MRTGASLAAGAGCGTSGLFAGLGAVLLVVSAALVSFALACRGGGAEWGATDHTIGVGVLLGAVIDLAIVGVGLVGAALGVGGLVLLGFAVLGGALGATALSRLRQRGVPPDAERER
jgi:hypothetical protein